MISDDKLDVDITRRSLFTKSIDMLMINSRGTATIAFTDSHWGSYSALLFNSFLGWINVQYDGIRWCLLGTV